MKTLNEVRNAATAAKQNVVVSVDKAKAVLNSPFAVINEIKRQGGEEFANLLQFLGISKKQFGLNPETFGKYLYNDETNGNILVTRCTKKDLENAELIKYVIDNESYKRASNSIAAFKAVLKRVVADRAATLREESDEYKARAAKRAANADKMAKAREKAKAKKAEFEKSIALSTLTSQYLTLQPELSAAEARAKAEKAYEDILKQRNEK